MPGTQPVPIRPGDRFLDLEVLDRIGRGAFATVYRARDTLLGRVVALKVFDPARIQDPESGRADVLKEARMVAQIRSTHVVTLYRVHELPDGPWVCELEYVDGGDLRGRIDANRALPPEEAQRIVHAVLSGLAEAHAHGIVHGDVKPANILLGSDGSVKLTDFGLGLFTQEEALSLGRGGGPRGTPHYMAPEVVMGSPPTPAADVWSVGVLLYRMLAGRLPFAHSEWGPLFFSIQNDAPPPLPAETPTALRDLTLSCLAKSPSERAADAAEVLARFRTARKAPDRSAAPTPTPVLGRPVPHLVGRSDALRTLRSRLDAACRGEGGGVLVLGEAGIGKTALLQGLRREAAAHNVRCLETRLSSLGGLRRPLLHTVRAALESANAEEPASSTGSTSSAVRAERLAQIAEAEQAVAETEAYPAAAVIERSLVELAAEHPILLIVDDVHMGDREDLGLLGALVATLADHPAMVALAWRSRAPRVSDSSDAWTPDHHELLRLPGMVRLDLEPLSDGAMRELVENLAGTKILPPALVERVLDAAEGIPLYAVALYRHLEDAGEITRSGDAVRFTARWSDTEPPPLLRDLVTRRLSGLSPEQHRLLETAAVSGGTFSGQQLAALHDQPLLEVLRQLQRLYRDRELVAPREHGFRFAHQLYREVITAGLAPDLRRALHEAWARLLESEEVAGEVDPELLGWHWEQAGIRERAIGPLRRAAWEATNRGEQTRAWDLAERSGILAEDVPAETHQANLQLLLSLQPSFVSEAETARVERLYARLATAADTLDDVEMRRRVLVKQAWSAFYRGQGDAIDEASLRQASATLENHSARAEACWMLGLLARNRGDMEAARALLAQTDAIYEETGKVQSRASILGVRGTIEARAGELATAHELLREASEQQAKLVKDMHWAVNHTLARYTAAMDGRRDGAADAIAGPIRVLERGGQEARAAQARILQAQLLQGDGRPRAAREVLELADPVLRESAFAGVRLSLLAERARCEVVQGELLAARRTLAEAEAGQGAPSDRAKVALQRSLLHAVGGNAAAAAEQATHGLSVVASDSDVREHARCLEDLVTLLAMDVRPTDLGERLARLAPEGHDAPRIVTIPARVLRDADASANLRMDPTACARIAACVAEATFAWYPADLKAVGSLFAAWAALADGDPTAAESALQAAQRAAREGEHVWLELRAIRAVRQAGLAPADPTRAVELAARIREQNAEQPDLAESALAHALPSPETP